MYARTQMFYAALSYRLHQDVPDDITATMHELQAAYDVFAPLPDTHFYASFGHLEGYGSGYYTYMWSLVIAKDLFSAFDRGRPVRAEVAHRYRDRVLAAGGSPGRRRPGRGLPRPALRLRGLRALARRLTHSPAPAGRVGARRRGCAGGGFPGDAENCTAMGNSHGE